MSRWRLIRYTVRSPDCNLVSNWLSNTHAAYLWPEDTAYFAREMIIPVVDFRDVAGWQAGLSIQHFDLVPEEGAVVHPVDTHDDGWDVWGQTCASLAAACLKRVNVPESVIGAVYFDGAEEEATASVD